MTIIGGRSKSIPSRCKRVFTKCLFRFTCPVSVQCPPAAPDNFSPHHVPCVNIPPPANLLPPTSQTIVENAKHTDKEKQGPIYQHRPDSSSFIGDKKRTAVHLSFAETGKTGICAQHSPLDHSLSKKTSEKVALCQELSRAASQGPKHPAPNPISHLPAIS